MKVEDLRIGNLLQYGDGEIVVDINIIRDFGLYSATGIKPIPLTLEWLKRFGFHKAGNYWKIKSCPLIQVWEYQGTYFFAVKGDSSYAWGSVHRLQNLYYALKNNQELKLIEP